MSTCDIVVDVGGEYNPKTHRYDHHQRDFNHTLSSLRPDLTKNKFKEIKYCVGILIKPFNFPLLSCRLSSAGLVYAHFGLEVISEILKKNSIVANSNSLTCLYNFIYEGFVEELDAIDNGIPMYGEGKPKYKINTHLSARIHRLNPEWNSLETESTDGLFKKAMETVGEEFSERVLTVSIFTSN